MSSLNTINIIPSIVAAKACTLLSRHLNYGGSTLPGRVALTFNNKVLAKISSQLKEGCILITGTNGKTTTAYLLAHILSFCGWRVIHNHTGANMIGGVATSFIEKSSCSGVVQADIGVIEVDEASLPFVAPQVNVKGVVVTNFFRDQLDRYGEIDYTLEKVKEGLNEAKNIDFVILNADDPLMLALKQYANYPVYFYGINNWLPSTRIQQAVDVKNCWHCGCSYYYRQNYFAHLGLYICPGCGIKRPSPSFYLVWQKGQHPHQLMIKVVGHEVFLETTLHMPGSFNLYNLLASLTCAYILGAGKKSVEKSLKKFKPSFGRMEKISMGGKNFLISLIKNPTGANEVIRSLLENRDLKSLILAINDNLADGTDVSWLWDVDFESIAHHQENINQIICSGQRAFDIALRLKYAGINMDKVAVEEDLSKVLQLAAASEAKKGAKFIFILPTYTALLKLKKIINDMGYGKKFWEV